MSNSINGDWRAVQITGKECDVFEPPARGKFAIVFLHGVGLETLANNRVFTELLAKYQVACICPHGKRSWWSNRICREFDGSTTAEQFLLRAVVPWIEDNWNIASPAIGLLGISMGGQGVLRLAFKNASRFPIVAAISAAIDFHEWHGRDDTIDEMYADRESARQDTVLLHLHPLSWPRRCWFVVDPRDDEWFDGNRRLHEKMAATGIPHTCDLETQAGGHSWEYFEHMAPRAIEFLVQGLAAEERRVV